MGDRLVTAAPDGPTSANSTRMSDVFRTPLPSRQERNASPGSQGPPAIAASTDDSIHRGLDGANNTVNQLGERLTSQVCVFTPTFFDSAAYGLSRTGQVRHRASQTGTLPSKRHAVS